MYIVTRALKPVPAKELNHFEEQHSISLPTSYRQWLEQYGEGTYTGWMNVQRPDQEVLKPFAEYDFWMHTEDTPVTQNQLQECISIGSSVDGDFLAIHPDVKGLLWLPRHDEHIVLWSCHEADFGETLDRIYCGYYHQDKPLTPAYFEPWNELRNHTFYHLVNVEREDFMKELADLCKTRFKWDAVMENEYTCKLLWFLWVVICVLIMRTAGKLLFSMKRCTGRKVQGNTIWINFCWNITVQLLIEVEWRNNFELVEGENCRNVAD